MPDLERNRSDVKPGLKQNHLLFKETNWLYDENNLGFDPIQLSAHRLLLSLASAYYINIPFNIRAYLSVKIVFFSYKHAG